jgi:hypothetical protein
VNTGLGDPERTIGQSPADLTTRVLASPVTATVTGWVRRAWPVFLFAWFAWQTYQRISFFVVRQFPFGIDARIYYRGVVAWLQGGSPWDAAVTVGGTSYHYAGSPVTTVILAPAALLSEEAFTAVWLILTWAAAAWTLRRLNLPIWWLLFPPISEALFSANPQLIVLALILADRTWLAAIATALKVYAFIPLAGEGRWRAIAVAVVVNAATIVIAPGLWSRYIELFGTISGRLEYESIQGFSAFYFPGLLVLSVIALGVLALRDRRAAGWLAVPAIWPASQLHYSTMALPVMSPLLAFFLAIPILRLPPEIILIEVARRLVAPYVTGYLDSRRQIAARPPAGA